jgi:Predicted ATP-dependent serine protease
MARAYSIKDILNKKYETLEFKGIWEKAVGKPQKAAIWFVMAPPKSGKTTFTMMLSKYLTNFLRVAYNFIEEGTEMTTQKVLIRLNMEEVSGKMIVIEKEPFDELVIRLKKHKSPSVVVIDSIQFMELTFKQYKYLKETFPTKAFILVSHMEGNKPDGNAAVRMWRDADVTFKIEGFRAFPTSRYGGEGTPIDIDAEKAEAYWGIEA